MARVGEQVRLLLLTTTDPAMTGGGGREMLSRLNRDILCEMQGNNFGDFLLEPTARTRPTDGLAGNLNGLDRFTRDRLVDRLRDMRATHLFVDGSNLGGAVRTVKQALPQVRIITFCHNVEARFFRAAFRARPSIKSALVWAGNRKAEALALKFSDTVVALSERDSRQFAEEYGRAADAVAPIALADRYSAHTSAAVYGEPYLLFVGGGFFGNVDGLGWYAQAVAPRLPLRTVVVGRGLEDLQRQYAANPSIDVIGAVDDLSPWYAGARLVVAPILAGSGMKTKVAEALMHGKQVVGTSEAFSGYAEAVCAINPPADDAGGFAATVLVALHRPTPAFDPAQRALYERWHSPAAARDRLAQVIGV